MRTSWRWLARVIREPDLVRKLEAGRTGAMACVSCNMCLAHDGFDPLRLLAHQPLAASPCISASTTGTNPASRTMNPPGRGGSSILLGGRRRDHPRRVLPSCRRQGGMDLNIKGLDDNVGRRLREQAEAAGLSVQQYLRTELTRIASRLSPTEFSRGRRPMNRDAFLAIRRRLRELDNSERRLRRGRHARRVEGVAPPNVEFLALDWSAVTVGRFLAAHYEGRVHKIRVEIGLVLSTIREWFPCQTHRGGCPGPRRVGCDRHPGFVVRVGPVRALGVALVHRVQRGGQQ